jgi:hypothetical protein
MTRRQATPAGRKGRHGYPDYKSARVLHPLRDWLRTGHAMRSLKMKSASENRVVIGFVDPNADRIAHVNNVRERQFAISPQDRKTLNAVMLVVLKRARVVRLLMKAA